MGQDFLHEVHYTQQFLNKKWQLSILVYLFSGPKFFGELLYYHDGISKKVLSANLQKLVSMNVVERRVQTVGKINQVEYSLTQKGQDLQRVLEAMADWGEKYAVPEQADE